ncbi:MAG: hypothetical protein ACYCW6_26585 [Candidatus Xenobia bacterium]
MTSAAMLCQVDFCSAASPLAPDSDTASCIVLNASAALPAAI